jgi:acyl-CoA thioesterase FadM
MECLDTAREVARGKIGIVFIDRDTRKVAAVPTEFLQRAGALPAV